jgi:RNA polymerase sigma factor (sigma-70 family)
MLTRVTAVTQRLPDQPLEILGAKRERVKQTADGVQQDARTEPDVDAAQDDPGVGRRYEGSVPETLSHQIVVGDIPLEPPGFQPRAEVLARLDRAGARVSVIHATTGLQGRGATQLAAAYARAKLAAGWRLVAWVNAADNGSMQAGLAAVAEAAGLTEGDSERAIADAGQAVRHLLESDGDRCLLIFDDVADPEALSPFVPTDGTAQVLIVTTRHPAPNPANDVPADVFSADEAVSFLAGRTGLDDEAGAAEVAAVLGYLPLALALAAPVIKGQRHGYARYLDRLQSMSAEVSLTGDDGQRYPHDVARAVLFALATVRAADKTGMCSRVTAIMAVLSPAGVRRELLHVAGRTGVLAGGGRRVPADLVDQVLEWLSDRSLLTFSLDRQTVIMHRVVAQVIRDGLARRWRLAAVCWVAASVLEAHAIAVAGPQDRPAVRRIPQQVTALLNHTAELAEGIDEELAEILLRLRFISLYHLIELNDSAPQAIAVGEKLTADLERLMGPGHPDTLNARNSLAAAYLAADRVADAIPLFEQTLAILISKLGPSHPDTLTSQNNLASAYQDAGRGAEAVQLYQQNLAERERMLGADDPGTLTSRGNLAAAFMVAGRVAEAIPLLEETLASRERVLGPDHPDTRTSRRNLARAYQEMGRVAEAIPLLEKTPGRPATLRPGHFRIQTAERQAAGGAAAKTVPASFRRPPADSARPVLPAGVRRPPADSAKPARVAGPYATPEYSSPGPPQDAALTDADHDRGVLAAIMAGDPAAIAAAYDRYAAGLYGYCEWMLRDSATAAESLQDTFVLAAATLGKVPPPAKLRPWLFALARNECRRRTWPRSATPGEGDTANQRGGGNQRTEGPRTDAEQRADEADDLADATMPFRVVSEPAGTGRSADGMRQFRAVSGPPDEAPDPADRTIQFSVIREPAGRTPDRADGTRQFRAVSEPAARIRGPADATMQFSVPGPLGDATVQFRLLSEPAEPPDGIADFNGYMGQAELQELIRSVLADLKPREREAVELSFRHDLYDDDLAIALGLSANRANALAARTRGRLEKSLAALRTALAGRQACPVVGELLADWDGQLTDQTRDLVAWHIEQCQICVNHARGALRPTVLSGLLPLPPVPPELREKVLNLCSSTTEDAVTHREQVVRRAESTWAAFFAQAIRRVSWHGIRAHPGAAVATTAVAVWVVAAVSITLLTFAGRHAAQAQAVPPTGARATHAAVAESTGVSSSAPAVAPTTARARTSAAATPSPVVTQPTTYVSSQVQAPPSAEASKSPFPKPSKSPKPPTSPKPSTSPSPKPSSSPSASPSSSPSPTA